MSSNTPEKHHTDGEDFNGLERRALSEGTPIDQVQLSEADRGMEEDLHKGARNELLAVLRGTNEKTAGVLTPIEPQESVELSPEQAWLVAFKTRFDALPRLHKGVKWADVITTLEANSQAKETLMKLDRAGFEMNVFGEKDGKLVFRMAQTNVMKIAEEYRNIMYDKKAQKDYPESEPNGNAEKFAEDLKCELADKKLYEQYRVQNGWLWLQTNKATRNNDVAFNGYCGGIRRFYVADHYDPGSFCPALRVQKTDAIN